ncbi:MAG TPA: ATP-binding cassette domain-containing protein, partial [Fimbriimonadaceae bacterium]|nr:ATP-binding cassette domain-containing protein [Fimbriimonadaceae bacterium]
MTAHVSMTGITQRFGSLLALDLVDFDVAPGAVHALVGENGAGKTTLMRVLYGALQPTAGEFSVGGIRRAWRNTAEAIAHGVGMVSQHYSIIPELTCRQNLVLGAEGALILPATKQSE